VKTFANFQRHFGDNDSSTADNILTKNFHIEEGTSSPISFTRSSLVWVCRRKIFLHQFCSYKKKPRASEDFMGFLPLLGNSLVL
jgi:hypothetical protein